MENPNIFTTQIWLILFSQRKTIFLAFTEIYAHEPFKNMLISKHVHFYKVLEEDSKNYFIASKALHFKSFTLQKHYTSKALHFKSSTLQKPYTSFIMEVHIAWWLLSLEMKAAIRFQILDKAVCFSLC